MQFWPRLEIFLSFVLRELRRFLFVRLCRLEIAETAPRNHSKLALHQDRSASQLVRERTRESGKWADEEWPVALDYSPRRTFLCST